MILEVCSKPNDSGVLGSCDPSELPREQGRVLGPAAAALRPPLSWLPGHAEQGPEDPSGAPWCRSWGVRTVGPGSAEHSACQLVFPSAAPRSAQGPEDKHG